MRLVIARCSVDYEGRLAAYLPMATRLIMVKNDGCVAVHADGGAYKPLNWMCAPNRLIEGDGRWECTNPKGERLVITIEEIFSDISHDFGEAPALEKDGVEKRLQELIAAQVGVLGEGWTLVRREYPTDIGPVDLLCRDPEGRAIAVEIKRRAEIDGVEQLTRYVERLNKDSRLRPVSGVLAYQQIKPQARVLAGERGFRCVELDYDRLRGLEPDALTLF